MSSNSMYFKKKILIKKHKTHRRLWLTSIITLFIFATSVSAYFLVKNSQDTRRSASEPYESNCTCIYNSACSVVNMKPCEGQCNPTCNYPAICCEPITEDLCTQGERYCVDSNTLAVCKSDRSGYTITSCASGTSCDSAQKACIADPTPNPSATCTTNGGQCMTVNDCSDVYMQTITGTCSGTAKCCKTIEQFACNAGEKECVSTTTRRYCNSERTAWITASCPSGSSCQSGTCIFPCQGSCYTGSSCSALGRATAAGTCSGTSTVCCQSQTTASCEGTCYTNSSCSAIGKADANGSCLYSSSVCCKEKTLAQAGSLELGESCENNSQCVSGNCNNTYINNVGEIVYLGSNYFVCVPPIAEQEQDKLQQSQNAALLGTAGAVAATTMVAAPLFATSLPALTPLGAYSYATATLATSPAWVQTGVTVAGLTAGWAGIAGGTYACATDPNSDACSAYMASLMADPTGIINLASATDDLINYVYKNPLYKLNFNVDENQIQMPTFNSESQPVEIIQVSSKKILIKNGDFQYLSIDLDDPLLQSQVRDALNYVADLPTSEQSMGLYKYSNQFVASDINAYDKMVAGYAKSGVPIDLSEALNNKNSVCFERTCFLNIANSVLGGDSVVMDYYLSSNIDMAGHVTNSYLTTDPIERMMRFNGTFLNTDNIGLIQRVNLFAP